MKLLFALVYVLVLATQLPHVWSAYANLEAAGWQLAHVTSFGAALAFELSTGVFTFRIVRGSRRRWTKRGLAFFIVASIAANAYYYRLLPFVLVHIWPVFAAVALPLSLALFAHEFGAEVKREAQAARRAERETVISDNGRGAGMPFVCDVCGVGYPTQKHLAGHMNAHREKVTRALGKEGG